MAYDNTNSGGLWSNKKASENPKAPRWTGKANIDGVEYQVSAWAGDKAKEKAPVVQLKFQKFNAAPAVMTRAPAQEIEDEDLPF